MTSRDAFGSRLRQHRERLGVTLESIVQTTKIGRPLLTALERGDLSRWPGGIYRRSFLRDYARAVRLAPEPLVREALQLFPEAGQELPGDPDQSLRLTLAPEPRWPVHVRQCLAAALDTGAILLAGYGLSAGSAVGFWPASAAAAVCYYAAGTVVLGRSPSQWALAAAGVFDGKRPAASFAEQVGALRRLWLPDGLRVVIRQRSDDAAEAGAYGRSSH